MCVCVFVFLWTSLFYSLHVFNSPPLFLSQPILYFSSLSSSPLFSFSPSLYLTCLSFCLSFSLSLFLSLSLSISLYLSLLHLPHVPSFPILSYHSYLPSTVSVSINFLFSLPLSLFHTSPPLLFLFTCYFLCPSAFLSAFPSPPLSLCYTPPDVFLLSFPTPYHSPRLSPLLTVTSMLFIYESTVSRPNSLIYKPIKPIKIIMVTIFRS